MGPLGRGCARFPQSHGKGVFVMPNNNANHSRSATRQPPIDWEETVGELLLSMPDDAIARTPATEPDLDLDDLGRFKRSLGSAPPARFNSEGGLCEPWAGGMDPNHDEGFDLIESEDWLNEVEQYV